MSKQKPKLKATGSRTIGTCDHCQIEFPLILLNRIYDHYDQAGFPTHYYHLCNFHLALKTTRKLKNPNWLTDQLKLAFKKIEDEISDYWKNHPEELLLDLGEPF